MVSWLRRLGWGLLALLGLLAATVLAWMATQGPDAEPRPRPAALKPPTSPAPDAAQQRLQALLEPASDEPKARLFKRPLGCARGDDCATAWHRDIAGVARQLDAHAALGRRCDAALEWQRAQGPVPEWLPEPFGPSSAMPVLGAHVACQRWRVGRALLAAAAGDEPATRTALIASHDWALASLRDARSLIGHQIAYSQLHTHLQAVAAVALRQPGWVDTLDAALPAWPAELLDPARWMPAEAAFNRRAIDEIDASCHETAPTDAATGGLGPVGRWLCRHRLGWHPEASRQAMDTAWLARIERLRAGPTAWLETAASERAAGRTGGDDPPLHWRNTYGAWLVSLGQDDRGYDTYIARSADLAMHRQLLVATLALRRAGVPPIERATWLRQHGGLPPDVWRRAGWEADGRALRWLSWADELRLGGSPEQPSTPLRIALDPAP